MKSVNSYDRPLRRGLASVALNATLLAGALLGLLAGPMAPRLRAGDVILSNALHEIRVLNRDSFRARAVTSPIRRENFARYRRLLTDLGAVKPDVQGANSEEATLLRVARELSANPERLDELLAAYGAPSKIGLLARAPRPPSVHAPHVSEAYRAAWEALLLAPPSAQIRFMDLGDTVTGAIGEIGNPESIKVLELAFSFTCEQGVKASDGSEAADRQCNIMSALSNLPTEQSLLAMLRSFGRVEAADVHPAATFAGQDLYEITTRFLTHKKGEAKEKWRRVLTSFPKDNLPTKQRELLDRATRGITADGG